MQRKSSLVQPKHIVEKVKGISQEALKKKRVEKNKYDIKNEKRKTPYGINMPSIKNFPTKGKEANLVSITPPPKGIFRSLAPPKVKSKSLSGPKCSLRIQVSPSKHSLPFQEQNPPLSSRFPLSLSYSEIISVALPPTTPIITSAVKNPAPTRSLVVTGLFIRLSAVVLLEPASLFPVEFPVPLTFDAQSLLCPTRFPCTISSTAICSPTPVLPS